MASTENINSRGIAAVVQVFRSEVAHSNVISGKCQVRKNQQISPRYLGCKTERTESSVKWVDFFLSHCDDISQQPMLTFNCCDRLALFISQRITESKGVSRWKRTK